MFDGTLYMKSLCLREILLLELKALNKRGGEMFNERFLKILDKNKD